MKTKICISVAANSIKGAKADLKESEKLCDLTELRIDFIEDIDSDKLGELLSLKTKEVIVTCRSKSTGGKFTGSNEEKVKLIKQAIDNGADYVDLEIELGPEIIKGIIKNKKRAKIIVSYHNFDKTPKVEELGGIYSKIKKLNPDFVKIVSHANSINDNFEIFKLLKGKQGLISFCMGLRGEISRILAPKFESLFTFASLEGNKESAPGQVTIKEIKEVYNIELVNTETQVVGVIGEFAENSMSKYMHNFGFKQLNLNFVYVPFKIRTNELEEFVKNLRDFNFKGSSVTIPHKTRIMDFVDEVDDTAKSIGAVNTLVNKDGRLIGYNTDYYGAIEALKEKINISHQNVLIIGAGGAARAVIYGLKKENAFVTVVNRDFEKASKLADEFGVKAAKIGNLRGLIEDNHVLINATSVGMHKNEGKSIINKGDITEKKVVMDLVYNPSITKLISTAKDSGCETITGNRMLIYQAMKQFVLWTDTHPGFDLMESALMSKYLTT
jgi:3-dehydroquinate dehydratase / shikimate dehydrogenase